MVGNVRVWGAEEVNHGYRRKLVRECDAMMLLHSVSTVVLLRLGSLDLQVAGFAKRLSTTLKGFVAARPAHAQRVCPRNVVAGAARVEQLSCAKEDSRVSLQLQQQ